MSTCSCSHQYASNVDGVTPYCIRCGNEQFVMKTANSVKNKGRAYYWCEVCRFFIGWCDELDFKPSRPKGQMADLKKELDEIRKQLGELKDLEERKQLDEARKINVLIMLLVCVIVLNVFVLLNSGSQSEFRNQKVFLYSSFSI